MENKIIIVIIILILALIFIPKLNLFSTIEPTDKNDFKDIFKEYCESEGFIYNNNNGFPICKSDTSQCGAVEFFEGRCIL